MQPFLFRWITLGALISIVFFTGKICTAAPLTVSYNSTDSWMVAYDGGSACSNCSATVAFTPGSWSTNGGVTAFHLTMQVANTSSITGNVISLAFRTTPDLGSDANFAVSIIDSNNANGIADEIFESVAGPGSLSTQGSFDWCMISPNFSCDLPGPFAPPGGGGVGIADGTSRTAAIRIAYSGAGSFTFDGFYVKYFGMPIITAAAGAGQVVPEPSSCLLLTAGLAALLFGHTRRKRKSAE